MELIIFLITGAIAAAIASVKGRSVIGWFFGGLLLGLIGIIIVAVLPNLKEQRAREEQSEREARRLREQLRQERMKNEAFRRHATARLDRHDESLGLDTRAANQPLLTASDESAGHLPADPASSPNRLEATGPQDADGNGHWYYERNGQAIGPTSVHNIRTLMDEGRLHGTSLVWTERLSDWTTAGSLPEFRAPTS